MADPRDTPERRLSAALQHRVLPEIDRLLAEVAGERVGFVLLTVPLDRHGGGNYASNCPREEMANILRQVVARIDAGPDVPLHEVQ